MQDYKEKYNILNSLNNITKKNSEIEEINSIFYGELILLKAFFKKIEEDNPGIFDTNNICKNIESFISNYSYQVSSEINNIINSLIDKFYIGEGENNLTSIIFDYFYYVEIDKYIRHNKNSSYELSQSILGKVYSTKLNIVCKIESLLEKRFFI